MTTREPKWKDVEKVVGLIEKAIRPDAKVKHNVMMPDLTEISVKRQCDIVIWSGKPPRETVTIVEVQDRDKKFNINSFDGMCVKREKVGASHLICVSRQKFPASIISSARQQGPLVRLVLFEELEKGDWPINIVNGCSYLYDWKPIEIKSLKIGKRKGETPTISRLTDSRKDKVFRIEGQARLYSLNDLINIYLSELDETFLREGKRSISVHFPTPEHKLWWESLDEKIEITALDMDVDILIQEILVPIHWKKYQQIDWDSPLAWQMEATMRYNDEDVTLNFVYVHVENGKYNVKISGAPDYMNIDMRKM